MTARSPIFSICLAALATTVVAAQATTAPAPRQATTRTGAPAAVAAQAEQRTPRPAPTASTQSAPAPREPRREGQPVNIKVDVTITDQRGGATAVKKTVTVVTGDTMSGFIRTTARYAGSIGDVPLNVDVIEPTLVGDSPGARLDGNKIRVRVNLQYDLPATAEGGEAPRPGPPLQKTQVHENLSLILENGKPIVAAQSADPVGDRQVTIEVKATVMR